MLDKELLSHFCDFLDKKIGLYYPKGRWGDLEKKLVLIKKSFAFDDTTACLEWLMNSPINKEKLDILTFHLTIGETYFFRDKQLFETLAKQIIPDIVNRRYKERTIRIWSSACCTGEEPYSIAILMHRLIPDIKDWKISILGSDINPEFLQKATKAEYKKWSFRATPQEIQEHYFKKNRDGTFTLIPEIKRMVNFEYLNLVDYAYPDLNKGINEIDLIFCHNILIYFSENQIKKTVHKLSESLCNNGWLSVTAIEVPFIVETHLNPHRYPGTVFFKKEPRQKTENVKTFSTKTSAPAPLKKKTNASATPPQKKPKQISASMKPAEQIKNTESVYSECFHLYKQKAYQEIIAQLQPLFESDPLFMKEHYKEVFLLIRTYANQGDLVHALECTERALQIDNLDPTLHYVHATLLHDQGNILEAIHSIKHALFLDSNFMMAYFMLGVLEKQQGNTKAAVHNFKIALDLINYPCPENLFLSTEGITAEYLQDLISNNS